MVAITPICRENVVSLASAYAAAQNVKISTVSRMCHSDPKFLEDFAKGAISVTLRKYDAIMEWFDTNWPANVEKPPVQSPFEAAPSQPTRLAKRTLRKRRI